MSEALFKGCAKGREQGYFRAIQKGWSQERTGGMTQKTFPIV